MTDYFEPSDPQEYDYSFALLVVAWVLEFVSAPIWFVGAGKVAA